MSSKNKEDDYNDGIEKGIYLLLKLLFVLITMILFANIFYVCGELKRELKIIRKDMTYNYNSDYSPRSNRNLENRIEELFRRKQ